MTVNEISNPASVRTEPDETFGSIARGIRHMPVLESKRLTGIISVRDITAELVMNDCRRTADTA